MYRTDGAFTDSRRVAASLIAGGVAGVVSWIPALPFDVVKSLIQVSAPLRFANCYYRPCRAA